MAQELIVRFTATFETKVVVEEGQSMATEICDIDIPDNNRVQYVPESFVVRTVRDVNGEEVEDWAER